ncbi:hypothetical protein VTJ49DRAFT_2379 [Mycothermus thermophilus]|uniref:Arb2 domain-containing protein n=1 Tax=Humicola insolens TaxID=85995 RepID=A0ABR3VMX2_HUMIN
MFRRHWSGLPADPVFPENLKDLGYFINDVDEVRSIEDPDYYFKYFISKNTRWNERNRFAFDQAIQKVLKSRLADAGFTTVPLPLGTPTTEPHVPILTSANAATASRVVVLFGETCQALGVFANRVIGGRGGVNRGSVLGFIKAMQQQHCSATDPAPPGLVVTNPGELWWWPEGRRGLTQTDRHRIPMASAVHARYHAPEVNEIAGNRNVVEHVVSIFESVVLGERFVRKDAKVDVIVVGDTAEAVEKYLDDDTVFDRFDDRLNSLVILGGTYSSNDFNTERFKRFIKERGRAYILHDAPLDSIVAGPSGNPAAGGFTSYGCPVYSAGPKAHYIETMLIEAQTAVLDWTQEVAVKGETYRNEKIEIISETEEDDGTWASYMKKAAEESKQTDGAGHATTDETSKDVAENEINNSQPEQIDHGVDGSPSKTDDSVAGTKENSNSTGATEAIGEMKLENDSAGDGPDAEEMKELVEEVENLKIGH